MSPWAMAAAPMGGLMTMISTSRLLALKVPQSRAAKSGSAVIVKPALEMRTLVRLSWLDAAGEVRMIRNSASTICQTNVRGDNRFMTVLWPWIFVI